MGSRRPNVERDRAMVSDYLRQLRREKLQKYHYKNPKKRQKDLVEKAFRKKARGEPLTEKEECVLDGFELYITRAEAARRGEPYGVKARIALWKQSRIALERAMQDKRLIQGNPKAEIQEAINKARERALLSVVGHGALDPAVLDGEVTLPDEVIRILLSNKKSLSDLEACLKAITFDNLAELVALLKSKNDKVKLKAFQTLLDKVTVDKSEIKIDGGVSHEYKIEFIAPDGRREPLVVESKARVIEDKTDGDTD